MALTYTAVILLLVIAICPMLGLATATATTAGEGGRESVLSVLADGRQWGLLRNSVLVAAGAALLATGLGVPLGVLFARSDLRFRRAFFIASLTPLCIPPYLAAMSWVDLLGKAGSVNRILQRILSLEEAPLSIYGPGGAILVLGLCYVPYVTLLVQSGLSSIDCRLEEASLLVRGAGATLRGVTLPLLSPFVLGGFAFAFILSFGNYGVPDIMRVNVYPVEAFLQFSAKYSAAGGLAASIPMIVIACGFAALTRRLIRQRPYVTLSSHFRGGSFQRLGRWNGLACGLVTLVVLVTTGLPVLNIIGRSGSVSAYVAAIISAHRQIVTSVGLAAIGASGATALGLLVAYCIERNSGKATAVLDWLSLVPFGWSGVTLGIGLVVTWNRHLLSAVYGTVAVVVIGYVALAVPFTVRIISAGLKQIDRNLEAAALMVRPSWIARSRGIMEPLCRPSIIVAWCVAYLMSIYEVGMTLLVVPPGEATLPIRIYTLMHYGAGQLVAALSMVLIVVGLLPVGGVILAAQARRRWAHHG